MKVAFALFWVAVVILNLICVHSYPMTPADVLGDHEDSVTKSTFKIKPVTKSKKH
ncbi:unnamed protein product [Cylicocyclus nassatus]|uniref:Uncharacterized protein n=1 Tax=Cylicocyclus nassatus TaxID=53992 RepID=A0AA36GYA2_CYLNA|nr:unnamed protein product [Cylicocyclus nassatus]